VAFSLKAVHSISRPKIDFLYFLFAKRVWYTCIKTILFIFQFFISALLQAKTNFARNGVSGGDRKAEIYGFLEACYGQLNAANEILL